jgi:hypothetical protein
VSQSVSGLNEVSEALQLELTDSVIIMSANYLYCDAAGGQDHGFIVVAGYLASFDDWNRFTADWNELLATYGLPYFHMKEFAHCKGPFGDSWTEEAKRARFLSKAAAIIAQYVRQGISAIVEFDSFNRVNATYRLDEVVGVPYSLAGRTCAAKASRFTSDGAGATYIFDDGDEGRGDLMRVMGRDNYPSPIFRPSRDRWKNDRLVRGVVPLQAADFAAYELRKAHKDDPMESWPVHKYRKSLQALGGIPSDWGHYTESDLIELCTKASTGLDMRR